VRVASPLSGVAAIVFVAFAGCTAPPTPPPPPGPPPPLVLPPSCEPQPAPVPILPRTSNDELRQLASDLIGAPVDDALFARWTPLAQVRGFDTMTESRIDAQTLEEQLKTAEIAPTQRHPAPEREQAQSAFEEPRQRVMHED
jgi:hypothetical protein